MQLGPELASVALLEAKSSSTRNLAVALLIGPAGSAKNPAEKLLHLMAAQG